MHSGYIRCQSSMNSRDITPPLLAIPLELREQIFKEVLSNSYQGTELLRTCHEIKTEAQKYLFQRNITFRGQATLYAWLEQAPTQFLHHVMEISIELEEPDLGPLLAPVMTGSSAIVAPRLVTVELHEKDLRKLRKSLGNLPNVKTLTVPTLSDRRSHFYRKFVADFLKMLSSLWPSLRELNLEGNFRNQSLSFLAALPELRSFSFDGFSASSPTELVAIFAQLEHLDSLSLVSQPNQYTAAHHLQSGFASELESFNRVFMRSMTQLTSFSVTERIRPPSSPALFFTPELLDALHGHQALNNLTFRISRAPKNDTLESLARLLVHGNVETLELDWPHLDPRLFEEHDLLPESLEELWVRVPSPTAAFDILYIIQDIREGDGMAKLKRVVLIREAWSSVPDTEISREQAESEGDIDEGYDDDDLIGENVRQPCTAYLP
jgi:hypothetical protein